MKNLIPLLAVTLILLFGQSCSKNSNSTSNNGNNGTTNWTFKGVNYQQTSCTWDSALGELSPDAHTQLSYMNFVFYPLPLTAGTYKVLNENAQVRVEAFGPVEKCVWITFNLAGTGYGCTGNDNSTVNVSISGSGKVSVTSSSVEFIEGTDSAAMTNINVAQQ